MPSTRSAFHPSSSPTSWAGASRRHRTPSSATASSPQVASGKPVGDAWQALPAKTATSGNRPPATDFSPPASSTTTRTHTQPAPGFASHIEFKLPVRSPAPGANAVAPGTLYDTELYRRLPPGLQADCLARLDAGIDALSLLVYDGVYRRLCHADPLPHPFHGADLEKTVVFFLEATAMPGRKRKMRRAVESLLCCGNPRPEPLPRRGKTADESRHDRADREFVQGVVHFWKLVAQQAGPDELDRYLATFNATASARNRLDLERIESLFSVYKFVHLQERIHQHRLAAVHDLAIFHTTADGFPPRFQPRTLNNGQRIFENQMALAVTRTFTHLKLDRITAEDWYITLGLLQEGLLERHIADRLDMPRDTQPLLVDLLGALLQQMQAGCLEASRRPGQAVSRCLAAATDQVLSRKLPLIQESLARHAGLTMGLVEDPTIADMRARQADLADREKVRRQMLDRTQRKDYVWDLVGKCMNDFLRGMGSAVSMAPRQVDEHDIAERVRQVFNGFVERFRDSRLAKADMRGPDTVPYMQFDPVNRSFDRYLYLMPIVCWHLMKIACDDPLASPEMREIWNEVRTASDLPAGTADGLFSRILFDLAFSELARTGKFEGKDEVCTEIALCHANFRSGHLACQDFHRDVLNLMNAVEERIDMVPKFDEDYALNHVQFQAASDAGVAGVDPAFRPVVLPRSVGVPSVSAESGTSTLLPQVHQKHRIQRAISRTTAQPCDGPPRGPTEVIRSGIALDEFRQAKFKTIDQGYASPSTGV